MDGREDPGLFMGNKEKLCFYRCIAECIQRLSPFLDIS